MAMLRLPVIHLRKFSRLLCDRQPHFSPNSFRYSTTSGPRKEKRGSSAGEKRKTSVTGCESLSEVLNMFVVLVDWNVLLQVLQHLRVILTSVDFTRG